MHDEQVYPEDAYLIVADFKMIMHKASARARSDVLRATPSTFGAKILLVATAMRSYRIRHLVRSSDVAKHGNLQCKA